MNKVITINLNGSAFQLEEAGYSKLQEYLRIAAEHLADDPDKKEILADIEQALADKCRKFISEFKNVITEKEIEDILKEMGPVNAAEEKYDHKENKDTEKKKKLFRNPDDAIIAGVASGIAAYFNIDPIIVRLFFVLITLFGGYGIVFYIVLWVIVPEAKSSTDKINMRGENVNLESLKKTVKEKVQEIRDRREKSPERTRFAGVLHRIALVFGKIIAVFAKVIVRIVGFVLAFSFTIAIIALTAAVVATALNINSPYLDFPLRGVITGWEFYLALFTVYFLAFVPLFFLTLIGQTLFRLKSNFNKSLSLGLFVIWIVSLIFAGALALKLAPRIESELATNPEYRAETRTYDIKDFQGINVGDANMVVLTQGKTYSVSASGRAADLDQLNIENKDGVLNINTGKKFHFCLFSCISKRTEIQITMPELKSLEASGASKITADNFTASKMDIKLSGASKIDMAGQFFSASADLSGASRLELQGSADSLTLNLSGASKFYGSNFAAKEVSVNGSGASGADVNATKTLDVKLDGASRVDYWGEPKVQSQLSGASHISSQHNLSPTVTP